MNYKNKPISLSRILRKISQITTVLLIIFFIAMNSCAQSNSDRKFLSAVESDPIKMGWMQGFPPPEDKRLKLGDGSFFEFPALRYSVVHMRQFMPTVNVSRGIKKAPIPFEYNNLDENIDSLTFVPWDSDEAMTWEASLGKNYTDGILILHQGKIVYEKYLAALTEVGKHAAMSVTKSFTGTLGAMLVAQRLLDDNKTVAEYVPELKNSGFADATVRQVMDMTTALKFSEDYADPNAEIWKYAAAGSPLPKPKYDGPVGYFEYLQTVQKDGEHGEAFGYKSINADALGWIISKVTGKSVAQLLSEKIWQNLGMEQDGYYSVDELGTPSAAGGFNAGLRDLGRFGELIRRKGNWHGEQIIPQNAIEDIQQGGSKEAFAKSGYSANDPYSLPAYQAVADYLIEQN